MDIHMFFGVFFDPPPNPKLRGKCNQAMQMGMTL